MHGSLNIKPAQVQYHIFMLVEVLEYVCILLPIGEINDYYYFSFYPFSAKNPKCLLNF